MENLKTGNERLWKPNFISALVCNLCVAVTHQGRAPERLVS
jgi:hypothetical protein